MIRILSLVLILFSAQLPAGKGVYLYDSPEVVYSPVDPKEASPAPQHSISNPNFDGLKAAEVLSSKHRFVLDHKKLRSFGTKQDLNAPWNIVPEDEVKLVFNYQFNSEFNIPELLSLNQLAIDLEKKLDACRGEQELEAYYLNHRFDSCLYLVTEIDGLRKKLFAYLLHVNLSSFSQAKILQAGYGTEQWQNKIELGEDYYFYNSYSKPKGYFPYSRILRKALPKIQQEISPLLIQLLVEISSLNQFPKYKVFSPIRAWEIDVIMEPHTRIDERSGKYFAELSWNYFLIRTHELNLLNAEDNAFLPRTMYETYDKMGHKRSGYMDFWGRLRMNTILDSALDRNSERIKTSYSDYFPEEYMEFSKAGIHSLRLLANLSFFVRPDFFGYSPSENISMFALVSKKIHPNANALNRLTSIIAGNLSREEYSEDCACRDPGTGAIRRPLYVKPLGHINNLRFYLSQSFPELRKLKIGPSPVIED